MGKFTISSVYINLYASFNLINWYVCSNDCYCGNSYGKYGLAANKGYKCNKPCPNSLTDACKGDNANYSTKNKLH